MTLHPHHHRAIRIFATAIGCDIVLGLVFSFAQGTSPWEGLYYATATATTVGADITPHGWLPHLLTLAMMLTLLPLFPVLAGMVTAGLTVDHIDAKTDAQTAVLKREIGNASG